MTIQFAPKTTTLVAAVQNTLTWGLAEFAATLGQGNGIIRSQMSASFQVTNNTGQVCYIGLSYTTIRNTFFVGDRKSIAAVPANASLNITPLSVSSLASIGPDIVSITMTLISAAAGTVVVSLNLDEPTSGNGGNNLFGLDDRSIQDYIIIPLANISTVAPGITVSTSYTVPAGKRAFVESYYASIPQTHAFDDYINMDFVIDTVNTYARLVSSASAPVSMTIPARMYVMNAGQLLELKGTCSGTGSGGGYMCTQLAVIREVF